MVAMLSLTVTEAWILMAKAKYKKTTTRTRKRKTGGNSGYVKCNLCGGTGRHKKPKRT